MLIIYDGRSCFFFVFCFVAMKIIMIMPQNNITWQLDPFFLVKTKNFFFLLLLLLFYCEEHDKPIREKKRWRKNQSLNLMFMLNRILNRKNGESEYFWFLLIHFFLYVDKFWILIMKNTSILFKLSDERKKIRIKEFVHKFKLAHMEFFNGNDWI